MPHPRVRAQTWFPLQIQIYVNGDEWLARKLTARGIRCTKLDSVFAWIEDLPRARRLANRFSKVNWPRIRLGNPSLVVLDIAAVSDVAHIHGLPLLLDNTVLSPRSRWASTSWCIGHQVRGRAWPRSAA